MKVFGTSRLCDPESNIRWHDQQHGSGVTGTQSWHTETFEQWGSGGGSSPLPASQVMSYDANGNRSSINESGTLYSYNNQANSNRLPSTAGPSARTYSYDAAGNVIGDGTYSYGYDDRGRLVDVDNAISYRHNGLGQRVEKDNGTDTRLFVYDDAGNLIGEYDDNGVAIVEHVWFAGAPVAVLEGSNAFYVHTDHLGTPRTITDGTSATWRWQSDPFGSTLADEDADGDATLLEYNLRFPGQYYDDETGLHYNYFRTYDPSTGRYLESDPIGLEGGPNTYNYVGLNPLSNIDPEGLNWIRAIPGIGKWIADKLKRRKKKKDDRKDEYVCPPDRRQRCESAFWRCIFDQSVPEELCIKAQAQCISSPLPTLFPHGEVVK